MFAKCTSYPVFYWMAVFHGSPRKRYNRARSGLAIALPSRLIFKSRKPMTERVGDIGDRQRFEEVKDAALTERSRTEIERLSPVALAYVGDAVYELYMRTRYLLPPKRISVYHREVVAQVRAETQARQLRSLEAHLTEEERSVARRGRNAATRCPHRLAREVYQQATSLETLIGYLYLKNPQRLYQLWDYLDLDSP